MPQSTTSLPAAHKLVTMLAHNGFTLTTVESCTGGALANALTDIPGSSEVFKEGFVVYSNAAKVALGVPEKIILDHTVYSLPTAVAMASAGKKRSTSEPYISVGITGSLNRADPSNQHASVIGEVYIAIMYGDKIFQEKLVIPAHLSRPAAKSLVVNKVIEQLLSIINN